MRVVTRALTVIALSAIIVLSAVPAFAHVTLRADNTAPGGFAKYTVRVPTESEDAATVRVEVQLPEGYEEARVQPLEGWDISISDGVLLIEGGRIEPGEFQEFAFSSRNPDAAGDVTFPAIQVYSDGEEVRWVGAADSDEPAPIVTIEGETQSHGDSSHGGAEATEPADSPVVETEPVDTATDPAEEVAAPATSATDDQGGGSETLSIVALIAGLLGLAVGGTALARTRTPRG
jgi:periplasmic copper chaperone A